MTQAYNLSQLANNLNTSGQLDATDGLVNAVPLANGGTGASSASAARTNLGLGSLATLSTVTDTQLNTTGVTAGTYGSATSVPIVTVTSKGRISSLSSATVQGGQFIGTAAVKAISYNAQTIAEDLTISADQNGLSAGPITINTGYTVTISTGGNWVIV